MSALVKDNSQSPSEPISGAKSEIRWRYLRRRAAATPGNVVLWQQALNTHLRQLLLQLPPGVWAGYRALPREADPASAIADSTERQWAYPAVMADGALAFFTPTTPAKWRVGAYHIEEPDPASAQQIPLAGLNGVLVPGVAFDGQGARLGFGKGFYDRALSRFEGVKIGVGFSIQVESGLLPCEDHDVKLDWLVTDAGVTGPLTALAGKDSSCRV